MTKRYDLFNNIIGKEFLHGGDYNPDQWLEYPEIIKEDVRLMKLAHINCAAINIFGWSAIEPEEGKYEFEWLDNIMDDLYKAGVNIILATPSGARPAWMSEKYPEVLRVNADRTKNLHGQRHNHCYTSPVYRQKTSELNRKLAERYKNHPGLILWHISNELGGDCHCELCQERFRNWLKEKYHNNLDELNSAWWTGFWSHKFNSWSQIESPSPLGEMQVHGHNLDWRRFVSDMHIDFYKSEIAPIREITPNIPVTTNFMGDYPRMGLFGGINYGDFAKEVDIVSWDEYPAWHNNWETTEELASNVGFVHDVYISLKGGQPVWIMESTPSLVNWHKINKGKRPGMHLLSSLQGVAHGADSVQYFQWRKGRGSSEKFHGAVVDHCGHENTRVFREVTEVGESLKKINEVCGTSVDAEVAIIFDWENRWAIDDCQALNNENKGYIESCEEYYRVFWRKGIPVDVITMDADFSKYKLVIAPMLYMVKPGVAERINDFVRNGGNFVTTYFSGIVNENDLCFLGGFPGPLREVTGIWAEEIDTLYDTDVNYIEYEGKEYKVKDYCDVIHAENAEVLARYTTDYYKGMPALTRNRYGNGNAYYVAARTFNDFDTKFFGSIIDELELRRAINIELPLGVNAELREDEENKYIFLMNFSKEEKSVNLDKEYLDLLSGSKVRGEVKLDKYKVMVLKTNV